MQGRNENPVCPKIPADCKISNHFYLEYNHRALGDLTCQRSEHEVAPAVVATSRLAPFAARGLTDRGAAVRAAAPGSKAMADADAS
jgi:hypothetical protein